MIRVYSVIFYIFHCSQSIAQISAIDSLHRIIPSLKEYDKAVVLNQIGILHSDKGLFNEAIPYFEQSLGIAASTDHKTVQLEALKHLSRSNIIIKKGEEALEYAMKMESLARQQEDNFHLARSYVYLARIKSDMMADPQSARSYLLKAIEIMQIENNQEELISAYLDLGITYMQEEQAREGIKQYEKGLDLATAIDSREDIRILKSNLAGAYISLKDYSKAYQYNKEALKLSTDQEQADLIIFDRLLMAMLTLEKGQTSEAINLAQEGLQKAIDSGQYRNLLWSYEVLLDAYKKDGAFEQAIEIAERSMALKDSLNQKEIVAQLAEKERAIALLQKDQDLLAWQQKAEKQNLIRNGLLLLLLSTLALFFLFYKRKKLLLTLQQKELDFLNFEKSIEQKERNVLKDKLSQKERALASKTMHLIKKNEILSELKDSISSLVMDEAKIQPQINKLNRTIENNINFDEDWDSFKLHFDEIHPQFFKKLKQRYPTINNKDIRFCAYIKMGLSTKEIAQLTGINATSVQKARYRLKKKMDLEKSTNLIEFINSNI